MGISTGHSIVSMPDMARPYPTLIGFLARRFAKVSVQTWENRIAEGKVLTEEGQPVTLETPYMPNKRLLYFREVEEEPAVPFRERILFSNDHLLVACKPHFLPVTPGGPYVRESLSNRLKEVTGNPSLSPINRLDRGTAGVVLFSANKDTRGVYQQMFMDGRVKKTYEALARYGKETGRTEWLVENRLEQGEPWFRMKSAAGAINARTRIRLVEVVGRCARFMLFPITGKKHQLRIHLSELGFPIVNDRCYPELMPEKRDDFRRPLMLLSRKIEFRDPLTGEDMAFESRRFLDLCKRMNG